MVSFAIAFSSENSHSFFIHIHISPIFVALVFNQQDVVRMLRPAGSTALFLFSLIYSASAADYVTSEEIRGTETWMHFTYRASLRSRDANSVFQPVPQTTTSSQVVADDPMPTLVYNCHFLPNICRNVDSHATHGGKSKEVCVIMSAPVRVCSGWHSNSGHS